MNGVLSRISRTVNRAVEVVVALLAIFLTALLVVSVGSRYIVHVSITTSVEFTRIAFCWAVFLAAAVGVRRAVHVRLLAGIGWLPLPSRLMLERFAQLVTAAFGVAMAWYGYGMASRMFATYFPALQISQAWLYAALPTSGLLVVLHSLARLTEPASDPSAPEQPA